MSRNQVVDTAEEALSAALAIVCDEQPHALNPVVGPIYQSSLFTFASLSEMQRALAGGSDGFVYTRVGNPTVQDFERRIAALEQAEAACAFASGMGAISAAVLSIVEAGDRIVTIENVYGDAYRFFEKLLPRFGIDVLYVDGSDEEAVAGALAGARLLYLESPSSMVFALQDLRQLCRMAHDAGAAVIVDNSWATPVFQKPITLGADIVVHSASKYLSGHSDTVAGVAAGSQQAIARMRALTLPYLGAKLSPLEAFLLIRGLRTLPLRLRQHMASALTLAERLKAHPAVSLVRHPVYANHPGRGSLKGFSGLFSFEVHERVDIARLCDALRLFRLGISWGGHESLLAPALGSLAPPPAVNAFTRFAVSPRAIRLSVGLEDVEALWRDLDQALARGLG